MCLKFEDFAHNGQLGQATTLKCASSKDWYWRQTERLSCHFSSILYVINCIYDYSIFFITADRSLKFTPSAIFEPLYDYKLSHHYYQTFNEYSDLLFIYLLFTNHKNQRLPLPLGPSLRETSVTLSLGV